LAAFLATFSSAQQADFALQAVLALALTFVWPAQADLSAQQADFSVEVVFVLSVLLASPPRAIGSRTKAAKVRQIVSFFMVIQSGYL